MAKANDAVTGASINKTLGADITGKYATVTDVDRIVKDLNFFYIKATAVSTTTDFGALDVGDLVIQIGDAAGADDTHYMTVAAAGTLPEAAIVDDLYIVLRPSA
tara:strand:- start:37060 stop:37371 length:312 start_codon:yes stop_codon:yes gene_type:complete